MTALPRRVGQRAAPRPADERRHQIVEAALVAFAERGYRDVSTADIARRVGVSEPTIYRHFPSKLDVYLGALDHGTTMIADAWRTIIDDGPTPLDELRAIGRWSFEQLRNGPPYLALRARALVETREPVVTERLRAHFSESQRMVETLYDEARRAGQVPGATDIRARAWAFMGIGALLDRTQLIGLTDELDAATTARLIASVLPELAEPSRATPRR